MFMELPSNVVRLVEQAIQQFHQGSGFSAVTPIEGVGTTGMNLAIAVVGLHVEQVVSTATRDGFLDEYLCRHPVSGGLISLFNRVIDADRDDD